MQAKKRALSVSNDSPVAAVNGDADEPKDGDNLEVNEHLRLVCSACLNVWLDVQERCNIQAYEVLRPRERAQSVKNS